MTIEKIKEKLRGEEYDFLRKDKNLGILIKQFKRDMIRKFLWM